MWNFFIIIILNMMIEFGPMFTWFSFWKGLKGPSDNGVLDIEFPLNYRVART